MFISTMEVNSKKKLKGIVSGKWVSGEGKNRVIIFHCQPCSTQTLENDMHLVTLFKKIFKSYLLF